MAIPPGHGATGISFRFPRAARLSALLPPKWLALTIVIYACGLSHPLRAEEPPFRIGFSLSTIGNINENDAMAAVRIWSQALARELEIAVDPRTLLFREPAEIHEALRNREVDCINLSALEYLAFRNLLASERLIAANNSGAATEEYVLVVHKKGPIRRVADLRGHSLLYLDALRHSLSVIWLDTLLAEEKMGAASRFFAKVSPVAKVDKAILPVFFRQVDSCLVSRRALETMIELNPQLGQQLNVLTASPPLVPELFCFRRDYSSLARDKILREITNWPHSPAGRQILTIFQTDNLQEISVHALDSVVELVGKYQKLSGKTVEDLVTASAARQ